MDQPFVRAGRTLARWRSCALYLLACALALLVPFASAQAPFLDPAANGPTALGASTAPTAPGLLSAPTARNAPSNSTVSSMGTKAIASTPLPPNILNDEARFLTQASFGVTGAAQLLAVKGSGYEAWLDAQFNTPATSALAYLRAVQARGVIVSEQHPFEAIWEHMIFGPDQLRARIAYALSQVMVISNIAPDQNDWAMASWWDMLNRNAFGNFRQLLEDVTLHPTMGYYLNMLGNQKEDPVIGRLPNENFARELLQLFSLGLVQLGPDGVPFRDAAGATLPTYGQSTIAHFAKVFTGWHHAGNNTASDSEFDYPPNANWIDPMQAWPSRHSTGSKSLLNGRVLPAGQTPQKDLADALDNIFEHSNVGPFIARRLIQNLVTSNPSTSYVARVAAAFGNNGSGVRGDMKAVIRAILLDREARNPHFAKVSIEHYGKLREPVLRFTQLMRANNPTKMGAATSIWWLDNPDDYLGQSPLLAPSVFNFFSPFFARPGVIADRRLVSPEFQIATETQVVGMLNFLNWVMQSNGFGFEDSGRIELSYDAWLPLASAPEQLVDAIAQVMTYGNLQTTTRQIIIDAVTASDPASAMTRVKAALALMLASPDFAIQR